MSSLSAPTRVHFNRVFSECSAAQAFGHFLQDGSCSRCRIGGLCDRATDDQVTGSAAQGFSGCGDTPLIGFIGSGGPDTGNDENRFWAGEGANPAYFLRRADEAAQAGVEGHPDEELDLIGGLPGNAGGMQLSGVDAGEDGDGEELRRVGKTPESGLSRRQHARSTGGVEGDQARTEGRRRADGSGDRVGNVVELEVEENGQPVLKDWLESGRAGGYEQLQSDLEPAATTLKLADKSFGIRSSGSVEGNDESPPRLFPGVKLDLPRRRSARFGPFQTWHN